MSPDLKTSDTINLATQELQERKFIKTDNLNPSYTMTQPAEVRKGWETMNVKFVEAKIEGNSLLDIGHAQIQSERLDVADSSGIILSGGSLKTIRK